MIKDEDNSWASQEDNIKQNKKSKLFSQEEKKKQFKENFKKQFQELRSPKSSDQKQSTIQFMTSRRLENLFKKKDENKNSRIPLNLGINIQSPKTQKQNQNQYQKDEKIKQKSKNQNYSFSISVSNFYEQNQVSKMIGEIDRSDSQNILANLSQNDEQLDKNDDKISESQIDIKEWNKYNIEEELFLQLQEAFNRIDVSGDGYVSIKEIISYLSQKIDGFNVKFAVRYFKSFDQNKDGQIDLKEFIQAYKFFISIINTDSYADSGSSSEQEQQQQKIINLDEDAINYQDSCAMKHKDDLLILQNLIIQNKSQLVQQTRNINFRLFQLSYFKRTLFNYFQNFQLQALHQKFVQNIPERAREKKGDKYCIQNDGDKKQNSSKYKEKILRFQRKIQLIECIGNHFNHHQSKLTFSNFLSFSKNQDQDSDSNYIDSNCNYDPLLYDTCCDQDYENQSIEINVDHRKKQVQKKNQNDFQKYWCGLDQISCIIFQIDFIFSLVFLFYLNVNQQTLPDITGQYYMLAVYQTLGAIFFVIEVKEICETVKIPYSEAKESIIDKFAATCMYIILCWTLKIKLIHQYTFMLYKSQDNPIYDKTKKNTNPEVIKIINNFHWISTQVYIAVMVLPWVAYFKYFFTNYQCLNNPHSHQDCSSQTVTDLGAWQGIDLIIMMALCISKGATLISQFSIEVYWLLSEDKEVQSSYSQNLYLLIYRIFVFGSTLITICLSEFFLIFINGITAIFKKNFFPDQCIKTLQDCSIMLIIIASVNIVLKFWFIFKTKKGQILLIKTVKNRIIGHYHVKFLFIFNVLLVVLFITSFVIDPQCNYDFYFDLSIFILFFNLIQYFAFRAIFVKIRYIQKILWSQQMQNDIQNSQFVYNLFNKEHPQWLVDEFKNSECYQCFKSFGTLKIPLQIQKNQQKIFDSIKLELNIKIQNFSLRQSNGSTGNYFYEGQMKIQQEKRQEQAQNSQADFQRFGYGRFYSIEDGNFIIMEGMWTKNMLNGYGRCFDKYGNCYIGTFKDGQRDQYGIFFWKNGNIYDGYWQNNYQNGYGTFYYQASGESYIGFWKQDKIYQLNYKEKKKSEEANGQLLEGYYDSQGNQIDQLLLRKSELYNILSKD